jgi:hypothetical protein
MQIWKWVLLLGLLFVITYQPSGKASNFFTEPIVVNNGDARAT